MNLKKLKLNFILANYHDNHLLYFIRSRSLFISPKNKIPLYGFITGWWNTNWCFSLSSLISTWELGDTLRITMFWKYNKKRILFSLSVWSMKTFSSKKPWEILWQELLSVNWSSNHVLFLSLKFFITNYMYYLYILLQKGVICYKEAWKLRWILYYISIFDTDDYFYRLQLPSLLFLILTVFP